MRLNRAGKAGTEVFERPQAFVIFEKLSPNVYWRSGSEC